MKPIPTWRETLGNSPTLVAAGAVGQAMQQEIDVLRTRLADVEKDAARMSIAAKAALFAMYSALDNYGNTTRERDAMRTENAQLKESRDEYSEAVERLSVHREEMLKDRVALAIENERLKAELAARWIPVSVGYIYLGGAIDAVGCVVRETAFSGELAIYAAPGANHG